MAQLRRISDLSMADIRRRATSQDPLLDITPFQNDWQQTRRLLVKIARGIEAGTLPLEVTEVHDSEESPVPLEMLRNLIQQFRSIELQTQRDTMIELGELSDPADFTPQDEDWTQ
jgi:hypothetical protein